MHALLNSSGACVSFLLSFENRVRLQTRYIGHKFVYQLFCSVVNVPNILRSERATLKTRTETRMGLHAEGMLPLYY
jgi:hypothetical protein